MADGTDPASLEERVAALEATVAMLTRRLLQRGDITINDARATHGLPPLHEAGVITEAELEPEGTPGWQPDESGPATPPPRQPESDAIRWIEDPCHGPSRPRRLTCSLIFWRPCPHRLTYDRTARDRS